MFPSRTSTPLSPYVSILKTIDKSCTSKPAHIDSIIKVIETGLALLTKCEKFNPYEGEEELDCIIKKMDEEIAFFLEFLPKPATPSYPVHPDATCRNLKSLSKLIDLSRELKELKKSNNKSI